MERSSDSQSQQEMYHRNPNREMHPTVWLSLPDLFRSQYCICLLSVRCICLWRSCNHFCTAFQRRPKKTYGAAHTALLIGTAGVLISVVITIGSFITVSRQYGGFDKFLERYTYTLEQNFGIDLDPGSDNSSTDNGSDGTSIFDNNGSGDYL